MKPLVLDSRRIGDGYPVYFIAEIGGNFSSYNEGVKIIKSAIKAGANAVKVQTYLAENYVSRFAEFTMSNVGKKKNQLKIIKKLELDLTIQKKLFEYCKKKNITFFSTPSHKTDIEFLEQVENKIYKIGSDDLTNIPFIEEISKTKKPTIMSTGMSNMKEVQDSVNAFYSTENKKLSLLHCVSMYPFEPKFANLQTIVTMKKKFGIPIGWSDHTKGIEVCVAAAGLGANIIEKHYTLDRHAKGPDHMLSANPKEFSQMVNMIRIMETSKGTGKKYPALCEIKNIKDIRKSLVASHEIQKGTTITKDMINIKRPGTGLEPKYFTKIIGKKAKKTILFDEPIKGKYLTS